MRLDLDKIKEELRFLPPFDDQISLQGVENNPDPFFGCGTTRSIDPYKETDFSEPNFNLPYINSIIEKLSNKIKIDVVVDKLYPTSNYLINNIDTENINLVFHEKISDLVRIVKKIDYGIFMDSGPLHLAKKLNKNVKIISNNKKTKNYVSKNNILIKKFKFLKFENFIRRYL